jgi:hypothetical protein
MSTNDILFSWIGTLLTCLNLPALRVLLVLGRLIPLSLLRTFLEFLLTLVISIAK